jgi:2-amino-4-hydroxy-6-hydroxymethyldihydropteridine diphosphokinase
LLQRVLIGLGSNRGDKKENLRRALRELEAAGLGRVLRKSSLWRTEPKGMEDAEDFLNAAALIETSLSPEELLQGLLEIEKQMGRVRGNSAAPEPRRLDLDILMIEDRQIHQPGLEVPHPRLHQRRFALAPLGELAADWVHPVLHKTLGVLLSKLRDPSRVERFSGDW